MATPNYNGLVRLYEQRGQGEGDAELKSLFAEKVIRPTDFDFGRLFEECFGRGAFIAGKNGEMATKIMQEAGATTTDAFQSISGQVIYAMTMEAYKSPEFVFTSVIPERQSNYTFEKIAGITDIGDEIQIVPESQLFPLATVAETWRHGAETQKRGQRVVLTREALFFDRTGQIQTMASQVAKSMGQNREKRAVDCVIDENGGAKSAILGGHRYHYRNNSIATYGNSSGTHNWDNLAGSNSLLDWSDLDTANQLLNEMVDPDTAEPILFEAKHLVCAKELEMVAYRILNATEVRVATPGYATSANPTETVGPNPFKGKFQVLTSPYVAARLATNTYWFWGDVTAAFEYIVNWPMQVKQLAAGTQIEFDQDIVLQFRVDERGNYSTKEPRCIVQNT